MSNVNSCTVSGNLTRDIELHKTASDFVIGRASIAVERNKKVDDEWTTETSFFDVTIFGGSAEFAARKLRKGDLVTIQGRLEQQTWEKDGEKRSKVVIIATAVDANGFFRPKDEDNELVYSTAGGGQAAAPAQTQLKDDDDIPF